MILFHDFHWRLTGEKCNKFGTVGLSANDGEFHTICEIKQTQFIK